MLIRNASAERDAAACAAIYAPYVRATPISLEERPPSTSELAERITNTTRTHPWLVAQDGDDVLGYAYATRHRERASYRWAADVTVYVSEGHQRRGIGRALYRTLFDMLGLQGFRIACAGITLPNAASVGLHESLGFQPVGIYRRIGWKLGAWHDVGWWQLPLGGGEDGPPAEPGPPQPLERPPQPLERPPQRLERPPQPLERPPQPLAGS
jgi:L-amino acid N-acyltransferase YncA